MAIFDIEIVTRRDEVLAPGLAGELSNALGGVLDAAPGEVWVRVRTLPPEAYAENARGVDRPSPVFVTLTASSPPQAENLERVVRQLTREVARVIDRPPENVHVLVEPPAKGRISFGGKVVR